MTKIDGTRLGNINARSISPARYKHQRFNFDCTIVGLVNAALAIGVKAGNIFQANFGGGYRRFVMINAPHDDRCKGMWADEILPRKTRPATNRPKR